MRLGEGGHGAVLSIADGASARQGAGHDEVMDVVGGVDRASVDRDGSMDETAVVPEDAPVDFGTPSVQGQELVSSQREQAGQRRDPDYVRRRQAKHTAKQNARRKRG